MSLLRDQMGKAGMKWCICQNKNVSMEPEGKNYRMLSCKLDDNVEFIPSDQVIQKSDSSAGTI